MNSSGRLPRELRILAFDQSDLITTQQALGSGLSRKTLARAVRDGYWERRQNGLYDSAPGHESFERDVWAAALQAGEPYAIGGEAALRLHGLDRRVERIVVWVPDDRRPRPPTSAVIRRDHLGRVDRGRGYPARIRIEDALVDVGQQLDIEGLVGILSDAARLRLTTLPRVRQTLDRRRRVRHRADFKDILDDLTGIESNLEYVYREDVERAHALPPAYRQDTLSAGTRTDVTYDEQALLVELDGRLGHEDSTSAFRDFRRDNAHVLKEYRTLRYGSADVRGQPCEVAHQVWLAMRLRGWQEPFSPCPRCPSGAHSQRSLRAS
ncbi:MAG TPA: type IV toxin-antitoxin system AbiEi family antitoxin domain-containing protein, partial [Propionicimonas sp.]|nr:type IV toxin-antitoxin system AbiEi family antitoxin domain-containing protein [Propionicimonas sp.]